MAARHQDRRRLRHFLRSADSPDTGPAAGPGQLLDLLSPRRATERARRCMTAFLVNDRTAGGTTLSYRQPQLWSASCRSSSTPRSPIPTKREAGGFAFVNDLQSPAGPIPEGGLYQLHNWRHDEYQALELSVRRTFAGQLRVVRRLHPIQGARQRRGGLQPGKSDLRAAGARTVSRGTRPIASSPGDGRRFPNVWFPRRLGFLVHETSVTFLTEYHTGFPFNVVNEEGVLLGSPDSTKVSVLFQRQPTF